MNKIDLIFISFALAEMRKQVFLHLCLYFSTDLRVIQNKDAQWKQKKALLRKNFDFFSFAPAELRNCATEFFLNFYDIYQRILKLLSSMCSEG